MDNQAALGCVRASADAAVELPLMVIMMMERLVRAKLTDVLWGIVCAVFCASDKKMRHWGLSKASIYTEKHLRNDDAEPRLIDRLVKKCVSLRFIRDI